MGPYELLEKVVKTFEQDPLSRNRVHRFDGLW